MQRHQYVIASLPETVDPVFRPAHTGIANQFR
jgi:hypothetical protein